MYTWDIWKVCLQTFRKNRVCYKLHGHIAGEFLGLRMQNFKELFLYEHKQI